MRGEVSTELREAALGPYQKLLAKAGSAHLQSMILRLLRLT